jgi:hypothetical protein
VAGILMFTGGSEGGVGYLPSTSASQMAAR